MRRFNHADFLYTNSTWQPRANLLRDMSRHKFRGWIDPIKWRGLIQGAIVEWMDDLIE